MDRQLFWMAFISLVSIRCHPRNIQDISDVSAMADEVANCAEVASRMMAILDDIYPSKEQPRCHG